MFAYKVAPYFILANTHMRLLYGKCIVLNSVPLSLDDLTVNDPRPYDVHLNTQFSKKLNRSRSGGRNNNRTWKN